MDIISNVITIPQYRCRLHHQAVLALCEVCLPCLYLSATFLEHFQMFFYGCYEDQTGLHSQLGLSFCPARDVPLDLSLVRAVHGQPDQGPANHQAPEGIPLSWVKIQAGEIHRILPVLICSQFNGHDFENLSFTR